MILKFYTEGCSPCKAVSSILDDLGVVYNEIDIGKAMDSAIEHRVMSVPTLLNTETGERLVGFRSNAAVEAWVDDNYS